MSSLSIFAGPTALQRIQADGLRADQFKVMLGASGGPKWFVLFGLDRYLFGEFFARRESQLLTLGSSAGAWRMCCLATSDPVAAIERLARSYSEERYSDAPTTGEITGKARNMLADMLGENGAAEIVGNAHFKTHIIADRCKGFGASSSKSLQTIFLVASALTNGISRKSLSWYFERTIFTTMGQSSPWACSKDLDTCLTSLSEENIFEAMIASGSIPFVLDGVRDIRGAKPGLYWDGGITDYHFDFDFHGGDDLVLYPHFSSRVIPGWFDKHVPWRKVNERNFDNVVLLTPSREFVASLPYGKIPDRTDFEKFDYDTRLAYWREVLDKSQVLADEFSELVVSGKGVNKIKPFIERDSR
ncbi:MAG: patatin-like phospholipase family protein [Pseudohongiella sp.]|nr:patatin-like phospholipase family protein [Pseudohongiella sp.]